MDEHLELDYEFSDPEDIPGSSNSTCADSVHQANCTADGTSQASSLKNSSKTCLSNAPCATSNLASNQHISDITLPQRTRTFHESIKELKSSESGKTASYERGKLKENKHKNMSSSASAQNALFKSTAVKNHLPSSVTLTNSSCGNSFLSARPSLFRPKLSKSVKHNPNSNSGRSLQLKIHDEKTKLCSTSETLPAPSQDFFSPDTTTVILPAHGQKIGYLGNTSVTRHDSSRKKCFIDTMSGKLPAVTRLTGPVDTINYSSLQTSDSWSHCHYSAAADHQMQVQRARFPLSVEHVDPVSSSKESDIKDSRLLTLSPTMSGETPILYKGKVEKNEKLTGWDHREPAIKSRKRGRPPKNKKSSADSSLGDARVKMNVAALRETVSRVSRNMCPATTLERSTSIVSHSGSQTVSSSDIVEESNLTFLGTSSECNTNKGTMKSNAGHSTQTSVDENLKVSGYRPAEFTAKSELKWEVSSSKSGKLVESDKKGSLKVKSLNSTPVICFAGSDVTSVFQCGIKQNNVPEKESLQSLSSSQIMPTSSQGCPTSLPVTSKASREASRPGPKSKCTLNDCNLSQASALSQPGAADSEVLKIQKRFLGYQMAIENVARMASIDDVNFTKALPAYRKDLVHSISGLKSSTEQCSDGANRVSPHKLVNHSKRQYPAATVSKQHRNAQSLQKKCDKDPPLNQAINMFHSHSSSLKISNPTVNASMDSLQTQTRGSQCCFRVMEQPHQQAVKTSVRQPTEVGKSPNTQFHDTQPSAYFRMVQQQRRDIEMHQVQSRLSTSENRHHQTTTAQTGTNTSLSECVDQLHSLASVNTSSVLNPAITIIHQDQVHLIPETLPRFCLPSNIEQGHQLRLPNNCALYFQFRSRVDHLLPPVYVKHTNMMEKLSADPANFSLKSVHVFMFYQPSDIALPYMTLIPYYSLNDVADLHRLKMKTQTLHLIVNTNVVRRNRFPNGETVLVLENRYKIMLVYGVPRYQLNPLSFCSFIPNPTVEEIFHTTDEVSPSIKTFRFVKVSTDSFVIDSRILSTTLNCRKITFLGDTISPYRNASLQPTVSIGPNLALYSCAEGFSHVPRESEKPASHDAADDYNYSDSFEGFDNTASPSKNILNRLSDQVSVSLHVGPSKSKQSVEIIFTDDEEDATLVPALQVGLFLDGVLKSGAALMPLTDEKEVERPCPARHKNRRGTGLKLPTTLANTDQNSNTVSARDKSVRTENESPEKMVNNDSKTCLDYPRIGACVTGIPFSPIIGSKKIQNQEMAAKLSPSKPKTLLAPPSERQILVKKEAPSRGNSKLDRLRKFFSGKIKPKISKHHRSQKCSAIDVNHLELKSVTKKIVKSKERYPKRYCYPDPKLTPVKGTPLKKKTSEPKRKYHYKPRSISPTTHRHEKRRTLSTMTYDHSKVKPIVVSEDSLGQLSQLVQASDPVDDHQVQPQQKQQLTFEEPVLLSKWGRENHDLAQPSTSSHRNGQFSVRASHHQTPPPIPPIMTSTSVTTSVACSTLKSHNVLSFMTLPSVSPSAMQQPRALLHQLTPQQKHKQPESPQPRPQQPPVAAKPGAATWTLPHLLPKPSSALELHALPRQLTPSRKKLQVLGGLYKPEVYTHEGHLFRLWRGYDADLVQRQATFINKSVKELASSTVERHLCMVCDLCVTGPIYNFRTHVNSKKHLHNTTTLLRTMSDMLFRLRGYHLAPINVEEAAKQMELVNEEVEEVDTTQSTAVPPAAQPTTTCPDPLDAIKDVPEMAVAATAAGNNNNNNATATILVPTTAHLLLPTSRSTSSNKNSPTAAIYIPSTAQLFLPTATSTSFDKDTTTTTILLPTSTQMLLPTVSSTSSNISQRSTLRTTQSSGTRQTTITCIGSTNTVVMPDDMISTTPGHLQSLPAAEELQEGKPLTVPSKTSPSAVVLHHTFWHQLSVVKSLMEEEGLDDGDQSYAADRPPCDRLAFPAAVAVDDQTAAHGSLEVKGVKPELEITQMTVIIPPAFDSASNLNQTSFAQTAIVNNYINGKAARYSNENNSKKSDATDSKEGDESKKNISALVSSVSAHTPNFINLNSNVSSCLLSGNSSGTSIKARLGPRNSSAVKGSQINPFRCQPLSRKDFNSAIKCRKLTLFPVRGAAGSSSQSGLSSDTGLKKRLGRGRRSLSNMVTRRSLADRLSFKLTPLIQPGDGNNYKSNQHANDVNDDPCHSGRKSESVDTARKQSDVCVTDHSVNIFTDTSGSQQSTPTTSRGGEACGSLASDVSIDSGIGFCVRLSDRVGPPRLKTPPPIINPDFLRRVPRSPYYPHPLVIAPEDLNKETQSLQENAKRQPGVLGDDETLSKRMNKFSSKTSGPARKLFLDQASCSSVATPMLGTTSMAKDPWLHLEQLRQTRQNIVPGKFEAGVVSSSTSPEIYDLDSRTTKRKHKAGDRRSEAHKRVKTPYVDLDKPNANFVGYFDDKSGGFKMMNTIEANAGTGVASHSQLGGNTSSLQPQPLNDNYDDSYSCMLQAVINMVSNSANPASEGLAKATPGNLMLPSESGDGGTTAESLLVTVDNTQEAQLAIAFDDQMFCDTDSFMRDVLDFDVEGNAHSIMQNVDVDVSEIPTSDATAASLDFKANASDDNKGSRTNHDYSENPVRDASQVDYSENPVRDASQVDYSENPVRDASQVDLQGNAPKENDFTPVVDFCKDFELSDSETSDEGPVVVFNCVEDPLSTPRVTRCADWVEQNPLDACWDHLESRPATPPVARGMQNEHLRFDGTAMPANFKEWKDSFLKVTRKDVDQLDPPAIGELDEIDLQFSIESDDLYLVNSGKNTNTEAVIAEGTELPHSSGPDVDSDQLCIKQEARLDAFENMLLRKTDAATEMGATNVAFGLDTADGQSAPLLVLSSEESVDGDDMATDQSNALAQDTPVPSTEVLSGMDVLAGMSDKLLPPFKPNISLPLVSEGELCTELHVGSDEVMTGTCMELCVPTVDRDLICKTVQESVLTQEHLSAKDWPTVERDERISLSEEYYALHGTDGGIDVALHGAEEVSDVALHETEEDRNVSLHGTVKDRDVSLHETVKDRDVSLHEAVKDRDVSLHGIMEDKNLSLHGIMENRNLSLHGTVEERDVSLHGTVEDRDVSLHGTVEDRDVSLHGTMEDKDVSLHGTVEDGDVSLHRAEENKDVSLHRAEEDRQVALHGEEKDREVALHGAEKDRDVALHGAEKDRDVALHGAEKDRDVSLPGTVEDQDVSLHGAEIDRDVALHGTEEGRYVTFHKTEGDNDVALHGAEDVRDVALHGAEEVKDVALHGAEEVKDVALHGAEDVRDVALHGAEDVRDVALHGAEDVRDVALHGAEDVRDVALHGAEDVRDVALHGAEDVRDVTLHEAEDVRDVALHGAEGDKDVEVNTHHVQKFEGMDTDDCQEVSGESFTSSSSSSTSSLGTPRSSTSTDQDNVFKDNISVLNTNENNATQNDKCDLDTSDMEEVGSGSTDTEENVSTENNAESPNRYTAVHTGRLFENSERDDKTDHDLDSIESDNEILTVQLGKEIESPDENALTDVRRGMNSQVSVEVTLQTSGGFDNELKLHRKCNSRGDKFSDAKNLLQDNNSCYSSPSGPLNLSNSNPTDNALEHNSVDVMTENTIIKISNMTLDRIDTQDTSLHVRDLERPASNTAAVSTRTSVDNGKTVPGDNVRPSVLSTALLPSPTDETHEDASLRHDPICVSSQGSTQLASTDSPGYNPNNEPVSSRLFLKTTQAVSASETELTFDDVEVMTKNLSIHNDEACYESGRTKAQLHRPAQGACSARMFSPRKSVPFDHSCLFKTYEDVLLTSSPRNGQLAPFRCFAECYRGDENNPSWKIPELPAILRLGAPCYNRDANDQTKRAEVRNLTGTDEKRLSNCSVGLLSKTRCQDSSFVTKTRSQISTDQSVSASLSETTSMKPSLTVLQRPSLFSARPAMSVQQHTSGTHTPHLTKPLGSKKDDASILLQKCPAETEIVKQNSLDSHHTDGVKSICPKSGSWLRNTDNVKLISKMNSSCFVNIKASADNSCFPVSSANQHEEVNKLRSSPHALFKSAFNVGIQSKTETTIPIMKVPETESSSCSWSVPSCQAANVSSSNPSSICTSPSDSIHSNEFADSSITLDMIRTLQKLGTNIRKRSASQSLGHEPITKLKRPVCWPSARPFQIVANLVEDETMESKPVLSCEGGERSNYKRPVDPPLVIDISDDDDDTVIFTSSVPSQTTTKKLTSVPAQTTTKKISDFNNGAFVVDPFELSFCVREEEVSSLLSDSDKEIEQITKKPLVPSPYTVSFNPTSRSTFSRHGTSSDGDTFFNSCKHHIVSVDSSAASLSSRKPEPMKEDDKWTFLSTSTSADLPLQSTSSSFVPRFAEKRFSQPSTPDGFGFTNFTQGKFSLSPSFLPRSDPDWAMSVLQRRDNLCREAASSSLCSADTDPVTTESCVQFKTTSPFAITPGVAFRDNVGKGNKAPFFSQPPLSNIASYSTSNDSSSLLSKKSSSHTSINDKPRSPIFKRPMYPPLKASLTSSSRSSSRNLSSSTACSPQSNGDDHLQVITSDRANVLTTKRSHSSDLCSQDSIIPNPMPCPVDRRDVSFVPNPVHSLDNGRKDVSSNPAQYPDTRREFSNPPRQPVHSRISFPSISSHWNRPSFCGTSSGTFAATVSTENSTFGAFQRSSYGDSSSRLNQESLFCNPFATSSSLSRDPSAAGNLNPSFPPKNTVASKFGSAFNNLGSSISTFPHLPARASVEASSSSTCQAGSNARPAQTHDFFRTMVPLISPIRSPPSTSRVDIAIFDNVCGGEAEVSAEGTTPSTPVVNHEHHSVREFQDMWDQMLNKPTPPITGYQGR